jgi:hypothetical protein
MRLSNAEKLKKMVLEHVDERMPLHNLAKISKPPFEY